MSTVDYFIVAIVLLSALIGAYRGFLHEVISVLAWVIAFFCAWQLAWLLEPHLGGLLADAQLRTWAARVILFLGVLLIGAATSVVVGHYVRLSIFNGTDRLLGVCFGLMRGALLVALLVMAGDLLHLQEQDWWGKSKLIRIAQHGAHVLETLLD